VENIKLYITGGSGAGASTIGMRLAEKLNIPFIDSDTFFHKPTDPPFQEQNSTNERNQLIYKEFNRSESWILSGSISTWKLSDIEFSHSILLNVGCSVRLKRLKKREFDRFGARIRKGGDMYDDHREFISWASCYEAGEREGRNLPIERKFVSKFSQRLLEIKTAHSLKTLEKVILSFVSKDKE